MSGRKSYGGLKIGDKAPDFVIPDYEGREVGLSSLRGKKVVLYFYPKDNTPGCTKEACLFRDNLGEIKRSGAAVLGVSVDSIASHIKFRDKYELNFPLLSDANKDVVQAYGVWKEKSMYGRKFMGIERTTFIIDEVGRISRIFPRVKIDDHIGEVLEALKK